MMDAMDLNKERRFIFFTFISIALFGLLMVFEASGIYAFRTTGDPMYFFKRQAIYFAIGIIGFFLILFADLEFLRRQNKTIFIANIVLLIVLLVLGKKGGGAKRWFSLSYFNIQPSEILKVTYLLYAAEYFRRKGAVIRNFKEGLMPLGFVLCSMCALLVVQPDLGSAAFWMIWTIFFLFVCRANNRHLLIIIGSTLVAAFFLIKFFPYRFRRMTAYVNPFADPRGSGFQIIQSQIAYAEGGIPGVGFGEGKQKLFFLPAAHTDFIFSVIAEEFGFIGVSLIIGLLLIVFNRMFHIVKVATDPFRRNILLGVLMIFFLEVVINVGVSSGLFPTKGLSFPFISYGGSNLIAHFILLGLFFNASRPAKESDNEYTADV